MPIERFYILCEGETEEAFTNVVLAPHFQALGVHLTVPILPKKKSGVRSGGWVSYAATKHFWVRFMRQMHAPTVWFSSLLDLYAIPTDFPGLGQAPPGPPRARVRALEEYMEADFAAEGVTRFTAHLQLHEFEALLLVDFDIVATMFPEHPAAARALRRAVGDLPPEDVDGGRETAPSKRIIRVIPQYDGLKTTAGPIIAATIGLPALRAACPHFDYWLSNLEAAFAG